MSVSGDWSRYGADDTNDDGVDCNDDGDGDKCDTRRADGHGDAQ